MSGTNVRIGTKYWLTASIKLTNEHSGKITYHRDMISAVYRKQQIKHSYCINSFRVHLTQLSFQTQRNICAVYCVSFVVRLTVNGL